MNGLNQGEPNKGTNWNQMTGVCVCLGLSALNMQLGSRLQMETQVYPKPGPLWVGGGNQELVVEGDWTLKAQCVKVKVKVPLGL